MKTKLLMGTILSLIAVLSCDRQQMDFTDNSFVFSAKQSTNAESLLATVTLTLDRGSTSVPYSIAYLIDDNSSLKLTDLEGNPVSDKSTVSFEDFPSLTWVLPVLNEGEHKITFKIRSESFSQEISLPFVITMAPFAINATVSTPSSSTVSTLLINLVKGIPDREYSGSVYIDKEPLDEVGFSVNFSKTPILVLEIPCIRPGDHEIEIELSDGKHSETFSLRYDEPLRHPNLDFYLSHDSVSGFSRIMVHDNPYKLSLAVKDSLFVTGACTYYETSSPDCYFSTTLYKTAKESSSLESFVPKDGVYYNLLNRTEVEKRVTDDGVQTYVWDKVWRSDSEGYWDYFETEGPFVHFRITSSKMYINVDFEKMQGLTVHVHCTESGCVFNGKAIDKDKEYTYQL